MSKFIKRIRKKIKFPNYILCLFESPSGLEDMIESFPNIFCFCFKDKSVRAKNLIYIDDLKHLLSISVIEIIFIKDQDKERLNDFRVLLENRRPLIFLEKYSDVTRDDVAFFQKFRFSYIETSENYSIWRHRA
jgi:hypothetical protein